MHALASSVSLLGVFTLPFGALALTRTRELMDRSGFWPLPGIADAETRAPYDTKDLLALSSVASCPKVQGTYVDMRWKSVVMLSQVACDVQVWMADDRKVFGRLTGTTLNVTGFASEGALQRNGDMKFLDGGYWVRQTPKVYYLFMAKDGLPAADVWRKFLAPGVRGRDYEALLHCQDEAACRRKFGPQQEFRVIPRVSSQYCWDLVSPMLALLDAALSLSTPTESELDKFVFVSDSTVPVKPFWQAHQKLTGLASPMALPVRSDFCVEPSKHGLHGGAIAVKASQWTALTRTHAKMALEARGSVPLNKESIAGRVGVGCLDEFWFFAALYGYVKLDDMSDPNFQDMWAVLLATQGLNLRCDTFMDWEDKVFNADKGVPSEIKYDEDGMWAWINDTSMFRAKEHVNKAASLAPSLLQNESDLAMLQSQGEWGPAVIKHFTAHSLQAFRHSSWLFARKITESTTFLGDFEMSLPDAFEEYVFQWPSSELSPRAEDTAYDW